MSCCEKCKADPTHAYWRCDCSCHTGGMTHDELIRYASRCRMERAREAKLTGTRRMTHSDGSEEVVG